MPGDASIGPLTRSPTVTGEGGLNTPSKGKVEVNPLR